MATRTARLPRAGRTSRYAVASGVAVCAPWLFAAACNRARPPPPVTEDVAPSPHPAPPSSASNAAPAADGCIVINEHTQTGEEIDLEGLVGSNKARHPNGSMFTFYFLALGGWRCVQGIVGTSTLPEVQLAPRPHVELAGLLGHRVRVKGFPFAKTTAWHVRPVVLDVESVLALPEPPVDTESPPPGGCVVDSVIYDESGAVYGCGGGGNWCSAALPLPGGCRGPRTPPKFPPPGSPCPPGSRKAEDVGFCGRECWTPGYGGNCCDMACIRRTP